MWQWFDPHPDVVGEPRAEHHAAASRDRDGVHPLRRSEDVVQPALLVRHVDARDPARVDVNVERMIGALGRDLELGIARESLLPFRPAERIRAVVQRVLARLLELLLVGVAPQRDRAVVDAPTPRSCRRASWGDADRDGRTSAAPAAFGLLARSKSPLTAIVRENGGSSTRVPSISSHSRPLSSGCCRANASGTSMSGKSVGPYPE